jgi:hypothetical protein
MMANLFHFLQRKEGKINKIKQLGNYFSLVNGVDGGRGVAG